MKKVATIVVCFLLAGLPFRAWGQEEWAVQRVSETRAGFESMFARLEELAPEIFDIDTEFVRDSTGRLLSGTTIWYSNKKTAEFCSILHQAMETLALSDDEARRMEESGYHIYPTDYYLNTVDIDPESGDTMFVKNIDHYEKGVFGGFTCNEDYYTQYRFPIKFDAKRLKRILLVAVNSFFVTDAAGRYYVHCPVEDFQDFLFVDDLVKAVTNIDFGNMEGRFPAGSTIEVYDLRSGDFSDAVSWQLHRVPASFYRKYQDGSRFEKKPSPNPPSTPFPYRYDGSLYMYYRFCPYIGQEVL